jgi:hypothetical protein
MTPVFAARSNKNRPLFRGNLAGLNANRRSALFFWQEWPSGRSKNRIRYTRSFDHLLDVMNANHMGAPQDGDRY